MLDADDRTYLNDALTPPAGHQFDRALITTYSVDLTTLLTIPLWLALRAGEEFDETVQDDISVFEALERTADRIDLLCEPGRIGATGQHFRLYGMLEESVHAAQAPRSTEAARRGSFHPKVWLLRFVGDDERPPLYRACILSRNVQQTVDWDTALIVEGRPDPGAEPTEDDLVRFVEALPGLVDGSSRLEERCREFARDLRRIEWDVPEGFDDLEFFAFGLGDERHPLPKPARLAVVSPFVSSRALEIITDGRRPAHLVSRATELAGLDETAYGDFEKVHVLDEAAEPPGADDEVDERCEGLHAKLFLAESDERLRMLVGSGNATNPVWRSPSTNIEFFAALDGDVESTGGIDTFFEDEEMGFGRFLVPFRADEADEEGEAPADRRLEEARRRVARADLLLEFRREEDEWWMRLSADSPLELPEVERLEAWPMTRDRDACRRDASALMEGDAVELRAGGLAFVTRFVAFEVVDAETEESVRFALNLDAEIPGDRRAALMTDLLEHSGGFLRYVRLLLASDDSFGVFEEMRRALRRTTSSSSHSEPREVSLLEPMVEAYCRDDERLRVLKSRIDRLQNHDEDVIPPEFDEVWETFAPLLDDTD